jgi:hypothetical protein
MRRELLARLGRRTWTAVDRIGAVCGLVLMVLYVAERV